jgi:ribose transport system substrate-binding protein
VAAADKMAEAMEAQAKSPSSCTTDSRTGIDRRDGFLNRIKDKYPNIKIVSVQYGGGDHLKSAEIAKAMIQVTRISKASAVTTAGRCGIVGPFGGLAV